ncbi:MAG: FG-GAP-like repeat-containing protein [Cellvibrionaceae bacterium]
MYNPYVNKYTGLRVSLTAMVFMTLAACGGGGGGGSATSQPQNIAPTLAQIEDINVNENSSVSIDAEATDSDGTIVSYSWTQISGESISLDQSNEQTLRFTSPSVNSDQVYEFQVVATDDDNATAITSVMVTVVNVNQAPQVTFTNSVIEVNEGESVSITANVSDDGGVVNYSWFQSTGNALKYYPNNAEMNLTIPNLLEDSDFNFELTVSDGELQTTASFTVRAINDTSNDGVQGFTGSKVDVYFELGRQFAIDNSYSMGWWDVYSFNERPGSLSDLIVYTDQFSDATGEAIVARFDEESEQYTLAETGLTAWLRNVVVADFNNDGLDDLYSVDHGSEAVIPYRVGDPNALWLQTADGSFVDSGNVFPNDYTHSNCSLDINNDGHMDMFEGNIYYHDKPQILVNNGNANMTLTNGLLPNEVENLNAIWCFSADFNRDGFDDLMLGIPSDETWQSINESDLWKSNLVLFGDGEKLIFDEEKSVIHKTSFEFTPVEGNSFGRVYPATLFIAEIDYNGDHCLDLVTHVTTYFSQSGWEVYQGDCRGGFSMEWNQIYDLDDESTPNGWTPKLVVKDFNDDGLDDFVGRPADYPANDLIYFQATESGGFELTDFPREYLEKLPADAGFRIYFDKYFFDDFANQ